MKDISSVVNVANSTGADNIRVVRSQGSVKYYNLTYNLSGLSSEVIRRVESAWPFSTVSFEVDGCFHIEYIVKPQELDQFTRVINRTGIQKGQKEKESVQHAVAD